MTDTQDPDFAVEPDPRTGPFLAEYKMVEHQIIEVLMTKINEQAKMGWRLVQVIYNPDRKIAFMERLTR